MTDHLRSLTPRDAVTALLVLVGGIGAGVVAARALRASAWPLGGRILGFVAIATTLGYVIGVYGYARPRGAALQRAFLGALCITGIGLVIDLVRGRLT